MIATWNGGTGSVGEQGGDRAERRVVTRRGAARALRGAIVASLPLLAAGSDATATVIRVGPGGDFAALEPALVAAFAAPGDHEIRLAAGTIVGTTAIDNRFQLFGGDLLVSGGWDPTFTTQTATPTILDGEHVATTLSLVVAGDGRLTFRDLTVVNGLTGDLPGGIDAGGMGLFFDGDGQATIERCTFRDNEGVGVGGLFAATNGAALFVRDNLIEGNVARASETERATGGALLIPQTAPAYAIERNVVRANRAVPRPGAQQSVDAAGLGVSALEALGTVSDNLVTDNITEGSFCQAGAGFSVRGFERDQASLVADRNVVRADEGTCSQILTFAVLGEATGHLANTLVSGSGPEFGVILGGTAAYEVTNLTVVGTFGVGGVSVRGQAVDLVDSLILLLSPVVQPIHQRVLLHRDDHNLAYPNPFDPGAVDPQLAAPEHGDLRPASGSPAIDGGTLDVLGPLGERDVAGRPRVQGATVDVGALETGPTDCVPSEQRLCLAGGRFAVDAYWKTAVGELGTGRAVALSPDTGYFWFFSDANVELVVKVLAACALNQRYWVFAGGLTNVEVILAVTDTATGEIRRYTNPQGTPFQPIQDTNAFATCDAAARGPVR